MKPDRLLEGGRESAYLRQVNCRRALIAKFLRGHVWTLWKDARQI